MPFFGDHQAGIETEAPPQLEFGSFDLTTTSTSDLRDLLRAWTSAAVALTSGQSLSDRAGRDFSLPRNSLTLTFGLGPGIFDERFGLAQRTPVKGFGPLPPFATDQLDAAISGGDLAVQACANDSSVVSAALQHFADLATGVAIVRWRQSGFRTAMSTNRVRTFRNLLGFKDGTANPAPKTRDFHSTVWISDSSERPATRGGTFLCVRRIRTDLSDWRALSVPDQQVVIGRTKGSGAPLSGGTEFSPLDLEKRGMEGAPAIPADSHVRLASPQENAGARLLRRGYNYVNGPNLPTGVREDGLLFLAFVKDIDTQFVPIQRRISDHDRLNSFVTPIGSAVFFVPPGCRRGGWVGEPIFT